MTAADKEGVADCLFCRIVAGELPAELVYESDEAVAFHDIRPAAQVHVLFIPRRHIPSAADLTPDDGPLLADIFGAMSRTARDRGLEAGYRVVTNVGPAAGQSVGHLHFHLLGGRSMSWPPG